MMKAHAGSTKAMRIPIDPVGTVIPVRLAGHSPSYRKKPAPAGAARANLELKEFAVRFYHEHKVDPAFAFRSKERIALYLHDIELPRHFEAARIPSWTRIRGWLPQEGRIRDLPKNA